MHAGCSCTEEGPSPNDSTMLILDAVHACKRLSSVYSASPEEYSAIVAWLACLMLNVDDALSNLRCKHLHVVCMLQGDGVWLPRAPFAGTAWVTALHRELFSEYTGWSFNFLELAATAGATKGFTAVIGFFHWQATNTGAIACCRFSSSSQTQGLCRWSCGGHADWHDRCSAAETPIQAIPSSWHADGLVHKTAAVFWRMCQSMCWNLLVQLPIMCIHRRTDRSDESGSTRPPFFISLLLLAHAGSYHGLSPTQRQSADYGVMHLVTDKTGKVTDVTLWRAGFKEERESLVGAAPTTTCGSCTGCV